MIQDKVLEGAETDQAKVISGGSVLLTSPSTAGGGDMEERAFSAVFPQIWNSLFWEVYLAALLIAFQDKKGKQSLLKMAWNISNELSPLPSKLLLKNLVSYVLFGF